MDRIEENNEKLQTLINFKNRIQDEYQEELEKTEKEIQLRNMYNDESSFEDNNSFDENSNENHRKL